VSKTQGSNQTIFVYDAAGNVAAEAASSTPSPLCTTCYLTVDHLGSTRVVSDTSGNVVARYDYLPFGEEIPADSVRTTALGYKSTSDGFNPKFTGQRRDLETGFDFFNARYYSGAQGRFAGADPGNAGSYLSDPRSFNGYSYVMNSPLANVDPSGLASIDINDPTNQTSTPSFFWNWNVTSGDGGYMGTNPFFNYGSLGYHSGVTATSFNWLSWIPSVRTQGQSFNSCMAQHANLYSIGGSVELVSNVTFGTDTSYSSRPVVSFFTGNAINALFFGGSAADAASTGTGYAPTFIGWGMGAAKTYGRRTTDIMALNLAGKGGVPIALSQAASKAGGISASAVKNGVGKVGSVFSMGMSFLTRAGIDLAFTGAEAINCSH